MRAKNRVDILSILGGQVANAVMQLLLFSMIGHWHGGEALGAYVLTLAICTPVFLALGLSLRPLYVSASESWDRGWFLRSSAMTAATCFGVAVAACFVMNAVQFVAFVAGAKALDQVAQAGVGVSQRLGDLRRGAGVNWVNAIVTVLSVATLGSSSVGPTLMIGGSTPGSLASAGWAWRGHLTRHRADDGARSSLLTLAARGLPLGGSNAIVSLAVNVPTFFLAQRSGLADAAVYGVLANLRTMVNTAYAAAAQVTLTRFSAMVRQSRRDDFTRSVARATILSVVGAFVVGAFLCALGPTIIPWMFGVAIPSWQPELVVLALEFLAAGVTYVCDAALTALQVYGRQLWTALATLVTAVVLCAVATHMSVLVALTALSVALAVGSMLKTAYLVRAIGAGEWADAPT